MRTVARVAAFAFGIVLAFATLPPVFADDIPPPARITIDGISGTVTPGTTLGQVLAQFKVTPRKGDLVSVTGRVLQAGIVSGRVLLDGQPATAASTVQNGSVITTVRGPNVREPVVRTPGKSELTTNPAYVLPVTYGEQVMVVRGRISGEVIKESAIPGRPIRPAVAVTFDDGPAPDYTLRILAILERFHVKATFFVVGAMAVRYPDVIRAVRAAGMSIQDHTWNHEDLTRYSPEEQKSFMLSQMRAVRALGLPVERWLRPPYGAYTPTTVRVASSLGMRTVIWSADPTDWRRPPASVIAQRVLSQTGPGGIALMHDGGGDRSNTVAALPSILRGLIARGYRFVTLT